MARKKKKVYTREKIKKNLHLAMNCENECEATRLFWLQLAMEVNK